MVGVRAESSLERRSPRWLLLVFALGCAAVAVEFACELLAKYYAEQARYLEADPIHSEQALERAERLQPGNADYHRNHGWLAARRGDTHTMRQEYREALLRRPASAYDWFEYAQVLAFQGIQDSEFDLALARSVALAPNTLSLRKGIASLGLNFWNQGGDEARRIWALAISQLLRIDGEKLLRHVVADRDERRFCGYLGRELGLSRWCAWVAFVRPQCDQIPADSQAPAAIGCRAAGMDSPDRSTHAP